MSGKIRTFDPATGKSTSTALREADANEVADACRRAAELAANGMGDRHRRADLLRAMAEAFEAYGDEIVSTAMRETALAEPRLQGELKRVCFQLRMFADVVSEGSYLEATIDRPGDTAMGPRPDLRRMLMPIGPVVVFGASNFPLAFSVPGGDTVAALAAGCPVLVKAHPAHPLTSQLCAEVMQEVLADKGFESRVLQVLHGFEAGRNLVLDPNVAAVAFTGSAAGGQALSDLIATRPDPIPFYGELSGINPAVVTPGAAARRTYDVADGLAGAVTGSAGQLCTKPGVVLVPRGEDGDRLVARLREMVGSEPVPLLTAGIAQSYRERVATITGAREQKVDDSTCQVVPTVLEIDDDEHGKWDEIFGPITVVVRYGDFDELRQELENAPGTLCVSVHHDDHEDDLVRALTRLLVPLAGRLVYNQQTTGVAVAWAQTHGGPWPSTTSSLHTSVGPTAMRRFLRPITWQGAPPHVLPEELADTDGSVPLRVDGVLVLPGRDHE